MSCGLLEEVLQGRLGTGNKQRVEGGEIRQRGRGQIRQDHAGGVDKFRFYFKHAQWPFCEMFHFSLSSILCSHRGLFSSTLLLFK